MTELSDRYKLPLLVVSDEQGNIFEIPELRMTGMTRDLVTVPGESDLIPMPRGSDLFTLPGRVPLGYDPITDQCVELAEYHGQKITAVAAFMSPANVQLLRASYVQLPGAPRLPMYSYTAVGWRKGRFYTCGKRIDPDQRQDCRHFDNDLVRSNARQLARSHADNRLWVHLMDNCVQRYLCPAARNLAMARWEAPLPVSQTCNAACLACISEQPCEHCVTAPQERIAFVPTVDEIAGVALPHLQSAPRAVVSFGQGCEGEPLLYADLLEEAIRHIRKKTSRGVINLNTNGSLPNAVDRLCKAGLDSIRVSLNSAQPSLYNAYHRPRTYRFEDLVQTLTIARSHRIWSSMNYFVFPGLTDHPVELKAFEKLLRATCVNMIQARNLNMDPEWYIGALGLGTYDNSQIGIAAWIERIRAQFPWIRFGYFNPPRSIMRSSQYPGGDRG